MFNPEFLRNYRNVSAKDVCYSSAICTFFLTKRGVFLGTNGRRRALLVTVNYHLKTRIVVCWGWEGAFLGFSVVLKKIIIIKRNNNKSGTTR